MVCQRRDTVTDFVGNEGERAKGGENIPKFQLKIHQSRGCLIQHANSINTAY